MFDDQIPIKNGKFMLHKDNFQPEIALGIPVLNECKTGADDSAGEGFKIS